ncbi:hypothetical protein B0H17DRAFT_1211174 [Mycena rosella]|uniref:Uncharacterized protein n=1 Tax=Mycena rosella TaxID=1033263 RepID=A0AAD7G7M5_MYCRO|nr:hypothetical protein B0H17DRAFT_1211174 [Mycena rosella]
MPKKRTWKRKSKQLRKNNKMWAEGGREELMRPHIEPYADALERGWRWECNYLDKVCNQYHAQISWRLEDHEEPELPLLPYDPFAPIVADATEEERGARVKRIDELNVRIQRWLKYRVRSLRRGLRSKKTLQDDPYAVLLVKLSGLVMPPKAQQGYQKFMHESYTTKIAPVVEERWAESAVSQSGEAYGKKMGAPFRSLVARELFAELPMEEQDEICGRATAEARVAKAAYEKALKEGLTKTPEARQKCINRFSGFVGPIMKGLQDYTGLQGFIVLGGPISKYNREIGTMHLAVGTNLAPAPVHFPAGNKECFSNDVLGFMKSYLRTTYTQEQCDEAALHVASLTDAHFTFDDEENKNSSDSDDSDSDSRAGTRQTEGRAKKDAAKKAKGKRKEKERAGATKRKRGGANEGGSAPKRVKQAVLVAATAADLVGKQYEMDRQANIARNRQVLEDMGLKSAAMTLGLTKPRPLPWPRTKNKDAAAGPVRRDMEMPDADAPPIVNGTGDAPPIINGASGTVPITPVVNDDPVPNGSDLAPIINSTGNAPPIIINGAGGTAP